VIDSTNRKKAADTFLKIFLWTLGSNRFVTTKTGNDEVAQEDKNTWEIKHV
jgi:hypothetical protein